MLQTITLKNAIKLIIEQSNRLDVLVNNAGYGLSGALEDLDIDEIKSQYETNVFGLIRTTQSVLPIMRKQMSGIIVNITLVLEDLVLLLALHMQVQNLQ